MGAASGSMSVAKFWVEGDLPKDPRRAFMSRVTLRRFQPLRADEDVEERYGWCALGEPGDLDLTTGKVFQNEYLTLGFRWDRFKFPAALVNGQLAEAMQRALARTDKESLSRNQKAELKQQVLAKLKQKYLPSMRMVDMVWHFDRREVFFWSHSSALRERLLACFELTFGLELVLNNPYTAGLKLLPGRATQQALQQLEAETFRGSR
jgi:hypothetical protein